jgi:hypothetical protein
LAFLLVIQDLIACDANTIRQFFRGPAITGLFFLANLRLHAFDKSCSTRTGGVFSKTRFWDLI